MNRRPVQVGNRRFMEVPILVQQVEIDGLPTERVLAGWSDLVRRVVGVPAT